MKMPAGFVYVHDLEHIASWYLKTLVIIEVVQVRYAADEHKSCISGCFIISE